MTTMTVPVTGTGTTDDPRLPVLPPGHVVVEVIADDGATMTVTTEGPDPTKPAIDGLKAAVENHDADIDNLYTILLEVLFS